MRRTRLVWFLLGTATTSVAAVASWAFTKRSTEDLPIISITEPAEDFREISAGKLLRDCGLVEFTVSGIIPDGRQIVSFPLTEGNSPSFACVSERIQKSGLDWALAFDEPKKAALKKSGFQP